MRQLLWLNGFPILPTGHRCSMQWLIDRFGGDLTTIDEDDLSPLIAAALASANTPSLQRSANMSMTPGVRLFWQTRLRPMTMARAQLEIIVPHLDLKGTPLSSEVTGKLVLCSDRRN